MDSWLLYLGRADLGPPNISRKWNNWEKLIEKYVF